MYTYRGVDMHVHVRISAHQKNSRQFTSRTTDVDLRMALTVMLQLTISDKVDITHAVLLDYSSLA